MQRRTDFYFIILVLLSIFFISGFALLAHEVVVEKEDWFDTRVFLFLKDRAGPPLIKFFKQITFFGSTVFIATAFTLITIWLLITKKRKDALAVGFAGIITGLLIEILKRFYERPRPDLPLLKSLSNYSFPSGHSFSAFIFYSMIALIVWRSRWAKKWKILTVFLLIVFILSIGMSRIILRYHYASDVVAGFCLGAACLTGYLAYKLHRQKGSETKI